MAIDQGENERVEEASAVDQGSEVRAGDAEAGGSAGESVDGADQAGAGEPVDPADRVRVLEGELEEARRALGAAKEEAGHLRDQYLRLRAEFENFRRRTRSEVEAIKARAAEDLVAALLPVIDNLERATDSARKTEGAPKALVDGVDMVLRQILGELAAVGVARIDALGAPFDPNLHEAVAYEESDEHPEGHVIEVFQTGYSLNEKVLRPSMVKVARARGAQEGEKIE